MKSCILVLAILLLAPALPAQPLSGSVVRKILKVQDLRDAETLGSFFMSRNAAVREKAVLASGSVQDTSHADVLMRLLSDPDARVRAAAAFALGQMNYVVDSAQRSEISHALVVRLRHEKSGRVSIRIVEALGKVGDAASLDSLAARAEIFSDRLGSEATLSIGRYAYRGIKTHGATSLAVRHLERMGSWQSAFALMRIADKSMLVPHRSSIVKSATSPDVDVRMYIATVLGRLADPQSGLDALIPLAGTDKDWRVRVNAIRALARYDTSSTDRTIPILLHSLSDPTEHLSLASLISLGEMKLRESDYAAAVRKTLVEVMVDTSRFSWRQQRESAMALAKIFGNDAYPVLADKFRRGLLKTRSYLDALGYTPNVDALIELVSHSRDDDPRLQRGALEAIQHSFKLSPSPALLDSARSAFRTALASGDMAVITVAATALADSLFAQRESVPYLLNALGRLRSPGDVEPMVAIIQALGLLGSDEAIPVLQRALNDSDRTVALAAAEAFKRMTGASHHHLVATHTRPGHTNFDWNLLDWIRRHPTVEVKTSRGTFRFKMLPDEAPFTCINFATLIKRKFYNGLNFHRVVPNFVIQGGDPRGDGWGGPGYAIRSEFSYAHYERGMVGVASAGKDTEGCQFFVTHSRQPHLDGRYTIFGRIESGMDIVDLIQVGDRIESMRFVGD